MGNALGQRGATNPVDESAVIFSQKFRSQCDSGTVKEDRKFLALQDKVEELTRRVEALERGAMEPRKEKSKTPKKKEAESSESLSNITIVERLKQQSQSK